MGFTLRHNYDKLPEMSTTCWDKNCITIFTQGPISLKPGILYNVDTNLFADRISGTIMQVQNHLCDKPWRVVNPFLNYPPAWGLTLTLQIITNKPCSIKRGEILCHIKNITLEEAFNKVKGNSINCIIGNNIYIIFCIFRSRGNLF